MTTLNQKYTDTYTNEYSEMDEDNPSTQNSAPVNVAPQSTHGHYINGAKKVIVISKVKEAFFIEGDSTMTSQNHNETPILNNSLVMPQQVYNPFTGLFNRAVD